MVPDMKTPGTAGVASPRSRRCSPSAGEVDESMLVLIDSVAGRTSAGEVASDPAVGRCQAREDAHGRRVVGHA